MEESDQQQPHLGAVSSGSGSSGWAAPGTDGSPLDSSSDPRGKGATQQSGAVTSGSPIPARAGKSGEPADAQYAVVGTLPPAPTESKQMTQKAVAGVIAAAVVLTLAVVVLLYLMTQGSEESRPAAENRTLQPPPASGPTDVAGVPRQVSLEGISFLLPAGWNYEKVQDGYNLGPPSNPSQIKIYLNYRDNSLQRLRPMCEPPTDDEETSEPTPDRTKMAPDLPVRHLHRPHHPPHHQPLRTSPEFREIPSH